MATTNPTHIEWTCATCGFPIPDQRGCLNIPFADLSAHKPGDELTWRAQHDTCLSTTDVYGIDVEQLRDHRGVLRWTHHLMSKNWFQDSTWDGVIASTIYSERVGA